MAKGKSGYKIRTIVCVSCGKSHTDHMRPQQKYCSLECYRSSPHPKHRNGEHRNCQLCSAEFYIPKSRVDKGEGHFCSLRCHNLNQGRNKSDHICKVCGDLFRWSPSRAAGGNYNIKYCSIPCRNADPEHREMLLRAQAIQSLGRMTKTEVMGYALLDLTGSRYMQQIPFAGKFVPDAVVPDARLVVQFDGDYWHDRAGTSTEPRIMRRVTYDRTQDNYVRACGWEVIRFWDSDLRNDPAACLERLTAAISRPLGAEPARDPLARV